MKMKDKSEGITKIHNVRFYNLTPRSINCLSYSKQFNKLAVSRSDASIEIWDMCYAPFLEKTISGECNSSVEGIAWADNRLFSVGLTGEICEWDLSRLQRKRSQFVTGNAIWCIDVDRKEKRIAVGTEEGYVNLFDITENELLYKNVFDKQEGRILCCKFNNTGEFIVTGSVDAIRIWDIKTGHAIRKITMSRSEKNKETIVWSLQVLSDFTIISGDSRGQLNVWDGNLGVQIESHQVLKADMLTVAVNEEEDFLVCSGIDPVIRILTLTAIKKDNQVIKKWVKFLQRNIHDHDVKALVCAGVKVFSGGVDGYLGISSHSKEKFHQEIIKIGPFLQSPCANVAKEARLILLRYSNYLELWKLGVAENKFQITDKQDKDAQTLLSLEQGPEKLMEFRSKNDEGIISAAISPDGSLLIYSTMNEIRMFAVVRDKNSPKINLNRIKDVPHQFTSSSKILFSSDSKTLFLVKLTNQVVVFKVVSTTEIDYIETIDTSKAIQDVIHLAKISSCGQYFIAAGTCRTIAIWKKGSKRWKHHINLPKYLVPTTAIAIHQNVPRIVATFTDGKIFEYDLEEMRFTCSTSKRFVSNSHTHCVNNIVLDSRNENAIILHNDTTLFVLKKCEYIERKQSNKSTKEIKIENEEKIDSLTLKFSKTYEHFVHLDWLSENELVVVGVNPVALLEQLPPALRRKQFGAM